MLPLSIYVIANNISTWNVSGRSVIQWSESGEVRSPQQGNLCSWQGVEKCCGAEWWERKKFDVGIPGERGGIGRWVFPALGGIWFRSAAAERRIYNTKEVFPSHQRIPGSPPLKRHLDGTNHGSWILIVNPGSTFHWRLNPCGFWIYSFELIAVFLFRSYNTLQNIESEFVPPIKSELWLVRQQPGISDIFHTAWTWQQLKCVAATFPTVFRPFGRLLFKCFPDWTLKVHFGGSLTI